MLALCFVFNYLPGVRCYSIGDKGESLPQRSAQSDRGVRQVCQKCKLNQYENLMLLQRETQDIVENFRQEEHLTFDLGLGEWAQGRLLKEAISQLTLKECGGLRKEKFRDSGWLSGLPKVTFLLNAQVGVSSQSDFKVRFSYLCKLEKFKHMMLSFSFFPLPISWFQQDCDTFF